MNTPISGTRWLWSAMAPVFWVWAILDPKAGLPVMEGKALLYKYLGGVDGVPIMLDTKDPG